MKGLFLAASKYPKNREARAPKVFEINNLINEIFERSKFPSNSQKDFYTMRAPRKDKDGNSLVQRYNKSEDAHYLASEKDGKKTKWTAVYNNGEWVQNLKS